MLLSVQRRVAIDKEHGRFRLTAGGGSVSRCGGGGAGGGGDDADALISAAVFDTWRRYWCVVGVVFLCYWLLLGVERFVVRGGIVGSNWLFLGIQIICRRNIAAAMFGRYAAAAARGSTGRVVNKLFL